jgi:hypothetical protein
LAAGVLSFAILIAPACAMEVAPADVEAAVRTLGFLDSMPQHSPITVSVIYKTGDGESRALAQRVAATLAGLAGPNSSRIAPNILSVTELAQLGKRVDVIYVLPGVSDNGKAVADFARRQHVLSISNDPACLDAQCCALVVRAGTRTEITLDTAVAQETGATFSSFFMMMVKRR